MNVHYESENVCYIISKNAVEPEDQLTIIKHYCQPEEINWCRALASFSIDVFKFVNQIKEL